LEKPEVLDILQNTVDLLNMFPDDFRKPELSVWLRFCLANNTVVVAAVVASENEDTTQSKGWQ
jgi:hypothetical protein